MNKNEVTEALKRAKEISQKRNFNQTIEVIINLKGIDLKKQESQLDIFVPLHYGTGKKVSICALTGPELKSQAQGIFDETITADDFVKYSEKKNIKKLARKHNFFVAQATIMPKIATAFGRVFGPLGKMPNPKLGCVVPPNANLKPLYDKLQKTLRLMTKKNPIIQCAVGKEDSKEEEVIDNILTVYKSVATAVPSETNNIKNIYLKLSMGKSVMVGAKPEEAKEAPKKSEEKQKEEKKEQPKESTKEKKPQKEKPKAQDNKERKSPKK